MILLLLGIVLWWAAHLFKRVAPAQRQVLSDRWGDRSKGVVAGALLLSLVLMVIGFRTGDVAIVYDPPDWGRHVNNLLMLFAVALFGVGNSRSRLRGRLRHPMLTGVIVWAVAHLLANGDSLSVVLFTGMGVWAVVEMIAINRAEPAWAPWKGGDAAGDVKLAVITVLVYAALVVAHWLLGYWPLPS